MREAKICNKCDDFHKLLNMCSEDKIVTNHFLHITKAFSHNHLKYWATKTIGDPLLATGTWPGCKTSIINLLYGWPPTIEYVFPRKFPKGIAILIIKCACKNQSILVEKELDTFMVESRFGFISNALLNPYGVFRSDTYCSKIAKCQREICNLWSKIGIKWNNSE